jgi:hypothetical protein
MEPPQDVQNECFAPEQQKDTEIKEIIDYVALGDLPKDDKRARRIALQWSMFTIEDEVLFYLDPKQQHRKQIVVPKHLHQQVLEEHHASVMGGHFSGKKMYSALCRHWWWDGMYRDTQKFASNCPQCIIVTGGGRPRRPPLHPIPVKRPFQIVGVDVMELPKTDDGN